MQEYQQYRDEAERLMSEAEGYERWVDDNSFECVPKVGVFAYFWQALGLAGRWVWRGVEDKRPRLRGGIHHD